MLKALFKKWSISASAILIGGMAILSALLSFNITTSNSISKQVQSNMEETNIAAITSISYSINSFLEMLEQHAKMLSTLPELSEENIFAMLKTFAEDERFERVTLVTNDGTAYSSAFGKTKVPDMSIMVHLNSDLCVVAEPRILGEQLIVDVSAPVYHNGLRSGRLVACVGPSEFENMFISDTLQGDAGLAIFTAEGTVVSNLSQFTMPVAIADNIFKMLNDKAISFTQGSADKIHTDIASGSSGWIKYKYDSQTINVNYQPLGINDWYMAIIATNDIVHLQVGNIMDNAIMLTIFIIIIVCAASAVILRQRSNDQKRIGALRNTYYIAIRNTNDIFYEADLDKNIIVNLSQDYDENTQTDIYENYNELTIQMADRCTPDTKQAFCDALSKANIEEKIRNGISSINLEYKILTSDNQIRWKKATIVPTQDPSSHTNKLVYMENDITEEKLRADRLERSATLDGLSKLYNKVSTHKFINDYLAIEGRMGKHALFLLDIDNFKSVNDQLGHIKGDALIAEYSAAVKKLFRADDIIGRVGGDEFMILIKNYSDISLIKEKAIAVCRAFCHEYSDIQGTDIKAVNTSASIGIALFNKDGNTFEELYKAADIALYFTKASGKNNFSFFSKDALPTDTSTK